MGAWDDFGNGFTSTLTLGACNDSGCGSGHNDSVIFGGNSPLNIHNRNSPFNPGNIIQEILQALEPLIAPFLLIVGGVIMLPILFDIIVAII